MRARQRPDARHALVAALGATGLLLPAAGLPQPAATLDDVLGRASAWVAAYGDDLSTVIADERYVQTFDDRSGHRKSRVLESEFAVVRVADRDEWVAFRDVITVDGARVADRADRLERLFLDSPDEALARARVIADESARYNLGPVVRNFNVPTAALFFLHPANRDRFGFRKVSEIRRAAELLWEIAYEERTRPTLIRTPEGRSIPARGVFAIEPESGRVAQTVLQARDPERDLDVRCGVGFANDAALGLPVPATMTERYEGRDGQVTEGVATYSNYRRFRVGVRMKKQGPTLSLHPH